MGKKNFKKFNCFPEDDDYHVKFVITTFDKNYCLAKINTANPAWKKMSIERNDCSIDIIYDEKKYAYRRCKTYKECEKEFNYLLDILNHLICETYDEEDRDYAEFVFGEKCSKDKDYVKCIRKFISVA